MNIHYKNYPTDYIDSLQNQGKRHKARCFWEYQNDVQNQAVNSISFYAKSWGYKGKGTISDWVREFKDEIQKYYDAQSLVNQQHYSSVINQSGRQADGKRTAKRQQTTNTPNNNKTNRTASGRQADQALNINNNNNTRMRKRLAEDFFTVYRLNNGKYTGARAEALEEYMSVDDIDHHQLLLALWAYRDSGEQMVGAAKFLRDRVYLNYIKIPMSVLVDDVWLNGKYDSKSEKFITADQEYRMPASRMTEKIGNGELKFIREVAA